MDTTDLIRQRLADLPYQYLEIIDDSEKHRGHAGALAGGKHFQLIITADCLKDLSRLSAHREIYARLEDLIPLPIHALQISVKSRHEQLR